MVDALFGPNSGRPTRLSFGLPWIQFLTETTLKTHDWALLHVVEIAMTGTRDIMGAIQGSSQPWPARKGSNNQNIG